MSGVSEKGAKYCTCITYPFFTTTFLPSTVKKVVDQSAVYRQNRRMSLIKRSLIKTIPRLAFKNQKMAFLSGPRQSGKTTLAKLLLGKNKTGYYNWDQMEFRKAWTKSPSTLIENHHNKMVVFDEIHKAKGWKRNLKGIYDTLENFVSILVTGSARLNVYKKGGDSLMGRYLNFRLHGFTVGELLHQKIPGPQTIIKKTNQKKIKVNSESIKIYQNLMKYSGFPEPYLKKSFKWLEIWRKSRNEKIIREDLRDLSRIPELSQIEMLCSLLPEKIGSPLSLQSLAEDLEVSHHTIKRWLNYLVELYYFFEIRPYSKNISRSLKKERKIYLFDWTEIEDTAAKFENLVACHLIKACHYWNDTGEGDFNLHYLRNKDKKEIDFLITNKNKPWLMMECKLANSTISKSYQSFASQVDCPYIQLLDTNGIWQKRTNKILVASASDFLALLP